MKFRVKVISRNPEDYCRETKYDINKVKRDYSTVAHPFQAEREYTRALNSAKLSRLFAKPFVSSLEGHDSGVNKLERHPKYIKTIASASCNGEIRMWDLSTGRTTSFVKDSHYGVVQGISFNPDGFSLISAGVDNKVKTWGCRDSILTKNSLNTFLSQTIVLGVHHSSDSKSFGVCGDGIKIYDVNSNAQIHYFTYGSDSVSTMRFSPVESNILASASTDRSLILYDTRQSTPTLKVTLAMRTNAISWNPQEAPYFIVGSDDSNVYAFDMRKMKKPYREYSDNTNAVLDVDFSPTGTEFVSGSYDRSIRIFPFVDTFKPLNSQSRDVYHTSRMQKIFSVKYSGDSQYIMSGSDEMNIRLWKANASKKMGYLKAREKRALEYSEKLLDKYQHHPEIKKISTKRHLPDHLYNAVKKQKTFFAAKKRKEENVKVFRKEKPNKRKAVIHVEDEDEE